MAKKDNFWTDKNIKVLTDMWNGGSTAADIADKLGATRNAVIGKANRLGLAKRPSPIKSSDKKDEDSEKDRKSAAVKKMRKSAVSKVTMEDVISPSERFFSILDIKEGMCRWPIGDPKDEDFHFCGKKAEEGYNYCEEHANMAYQVPNNKK